MRCSCSVSSCWPAGITILQVAANPYVTVLGDPRTASSRLSLTQAFNSLGTTIAPIWAAC
jgi:FHS family L-fucose permease-like MFS transporter